ncbi:MAG: hypothetical protein WA081_06065 [Desulfosalsimonadaceae bacterium]
MNKLVFTGIILITAPLVLSYRYLFNAYFLFFGNAGQGLGEKALREEILGSLYGIVGWPLLGYVGFILVAICLDGMKYRPRWFFWALLTLSVLWVFCLPAGPLLGLPLLIYLLIKKKSFGIFQNSSAEPVTCADRW